MGEFLSEINWSPLWISLKTVLVFPRILPASMDVAPYSPMARAKASTVPEAIPGPAAGIITFQNIRLSLIPRVLPA